MKTTAGILVALLAVSGTFAWQQVTFSNGGECSAHADAGVFKEAQSAVLAAVAKVMVSGCSANSADDLVATCVKVFRPCAFAIVQVHAHAASQCSTFGPNTFGCSKAIAAADGQTQAYIALFSKAIAVAVNNCPRCDPAFAAAASKVMATEVVKLTAQANAFAKAKVCVGPDQTATAEAFAACTSQVWAHGLAYAFAEAMISGRCTNINADTLVKVNNLVTADIFCQCHGWVRVCTGGQCKSTRAAGTGVQGLDYCKNSWPKTYAAFKAECLASAQLV